MARCFRLASEPRLVGGGDQAIFSSSGAQSLGPGAGNCRGRSERLVTEFDSKRAELGNTVPLQMHSSLQEFARQANTSTPEMLAEIRQLREERNAVILAHNYQVPAIQDLADFVGDSLGLAQEAART